MNAEPPGRLLKLADVRRETSLSTATIYRWMKTGDFPKPIPIGRRRVAWTERELDAWKLSTVADATS